MGRGNLLAFNLLIQHTHRVWVAGGVASALSGGTLPHHLCHTFLAKCLWNPHPLVWGHPPPGPKRGKNALSPSGPERRRKETQGKRS